MSGAAFRVDSDEGREVILDVQPALLQSDEPFALEIGGELPKLRLRMTNAEAADLLELLDGEIGEWARERGAARREFAARTELELWPGEADLLDPLDPKHPRYAENLADLGDARRSRERESM